MPNEAACFPVTQIPPDGARRGFRLGHDGLPLAFGSLCARLTAFHFEIKAKMNADDPCESPAEQPSGPSEPRTLPNKDAPKHSRRCSATQGECSPRPSRWPSAFKLAFNLYTKRRQTGAW